MAQNLFNIKIITNGDMSGNITSDEIDLSKVDGYAIQADYTGSPTGDIKIQCSVNGSTWADYPSSEVAIPTATSPILWEITTAFYDKVRVIYTASSGSGTLNVQINVKGTED